MPNLNDPRFTDRDHDGFRSRRWRVGDDAGSERLGASVWEVPPGEAAYPYHWHLVEEELIVVLAGRPSLRTSGGWRELSEGEVIAFRVGEEGAHQLVNRTEEPVRFLSISTSGTPEICIYPDSNKLGAYGRADSELRELYFRSDAVDYWEGEEPPAP
jgi:uncharacterized cupin superfamily protein